MAEAAAVCSHFCQRISTPEPAVWGMYLVDLWPCRRWRMFEVGRCRCLRALSWLTMSWARSGCAERSSPQFPMSSVSASWLRSTRSSPPRPLTQTRVNPKGSRSMQQCPQQSLAWEIWASGRQPCRRTARSSVLRGWCRRSSALRSTGRRFTGLCKEADGSTSSKVQLDHRCILRSPTSIHDAVSDDVLEEEPDLGTAKSAASGQCHPKQRSTLLSHGCEPGHDGLAFDRCQPREIGHATGESTLEHGGYRAEADDLAALRGRRCLLASTIMLVDV